MCQNGESLLENSYCADFSKVRVFGVDKGRSVHRPAFELTAQAHEIK